MIHTRTKILFSSLIFGLGALFFLVPTHQASATLPTVDGGNIVQSTLNAVFDGMSYAEEVMQGIKEFGGDEAAYMVAQGLQENLVGNIVNWSNTGGLEGNPLYITNQKSFMTEVQDTEILRLFADVDASSSNNNSNVFSNFSSTGNNNQNTNQQCPSGQTYDPNLPGCVLGTVTVTGNQSGSGSTPSFENLSELDKTVVARIVEDEKKPLDEKLEPTLDANQRQGFSNDFAQGGWAAWDKLGKPSNNPIGRESIIRQEYEKRVDEAQKAAEQEAEQNDGFTSQKDCAAQRENSTTGGFDLSSFNFNVQQNNTSHTDPDCEQEQTQTPGKTNEGLLTQALGSGGEQLQNIDELMELASNALMQLSTQLITDGVSRLSGGTSTTSSNIGGVIDWNGDNNGATLIQQNTGSADWQLAPDIVVDLRTELPQAIKNTGTAVAYLQKITELQNASLVDTMDLDYLKPGQDVGWIDRLRDYHQENQEDEVNKEQDRLFAEGVSETREILDSTDHIPGISLLEYQSTNDLINDLPNIGREHTRNVGQLAQFQGVLRRLYSIKGVVTDYAGFQNHAPGFYNWDAPTGEFGEYGEWVEVLPTDQQWDDWEQNTPEEELNRYRALFNQLRTEIPQQSALTRIQSSYTKALDTQKETKRLVGVWEDYWEEHYTLQPDLSGLADAMSTMGDVLGTLVANDPLAPQEAHDIVELIDQFDYTEIPSNSSVVQQLRQEESQRGVAKEIESRIVNALPIPQAALDGLSQATEDVSSAIFGNNNATTPENLLRRDREHKLYCAFAEKPWDKSGINCSPDEMRDNWYRANKYDYRKVFNPELP